MNSQPVMASRELWYTGQARNSSSATDVNPTQIFCNVERFMAGRVLSSESRPVFIWRA